MEESLETSAAQRMQQFAVQDAQRQADIQNRMEDSRLERKVTERFRQMELAMNDSAPVAASGSGNPSAIDEPPNQPAVTYEQLLAIFPNANKDVLKQVHAQLVEYMDDYGITTEIQLAHFLAQAGAETGGFAKAASVENLNYSAGRLKVVFRRYFPGKGRVPRNPADYAGNPSGLANYVYGNRMGNGDEASGEGYLYRGRGIFQLTGKDNYSSFNRYYRHKIGTDVDFVTNPDLISSNVGYAVQSALWYYQNRVMNRITIDGLTSVDDVTARVNGGDHGIVQRRAYFKRAVMYLILRPNRLEQ